MTADKNTSASAPGWTPFNEAIAPEVSGDAPWLRRARLQTFRLLSALATAGLLFLAIRTGVLRGEVQLADIANAALFGLLFTLSFLRPRWLSALTWLGLASLFINVVDGLDFYSEQAVTGTHALLPLLILYAALLGDLYMSLTALLGVLSIYVAGWLSHGELDYRETVLLTNLMVLALLTGIAALGVWLRHSRLERMLDQQAKALRAELETRLKVQAMVTHDIRTPLTALMLALDLDDRQTAQEMAGRISRIIDSAQGLTKGSGVSPSEVSIAQVWQYTRETFASSLADKGQSLSLSGEQSLMVQADLPLLCNSVLGNFITNAIKFSPRGATIRMTAEPLNGQVRIAVFDQGPGLPPSPMREQHNVSLAPRKGTEGEQGTGYGLQIAALCAARMNGRIEATGDFGGGAISVVLPRLQPDARPASSVPE